MRHLVGLGALTLAAALPVRAAGFTNVTAQTGLTDALGYRCSVGDINGDGYPDLLLHRSSNFSTGDVQNKQYVYLNVQDVPGDPTSRKYVDYTADSRVRWTRAGAASGHQSDGVVLADVDDDGDLDAFFFVYVHDNFTLPGKSDLMLNDGTGRFSYAPSSPFHTEPVRNTTDAVWLDFDNDGNVDLSVGNYYWQNQPTQQLLYKGGGDGTFTNVTASSGIGSRTNVTYAISTADWNGDGFMDLFAPLYDYLNPSLACLHWRNNGDGTFTEVGASSRYADNRGFLSGVASFGTMFRDYDNDGDPDFLEILVHGGTQRGKFSGPVRNEAGVFSWDWARVKNRGSEDPDTAHDGDHQASWLDYDGDGLSDFVLTESFYDNNRLYLFKQDPDHTFRPVTLESGLDAVNALNGASYDVIPLDYDRDGDEDLLVGFADETNAVQLWRNDVGNQNGWLSVRLEGGGTAGYANRAGIGARIEVTAGGVTQTREIYAGPGQHAPQAPLDQTFGAGGAGVIDRVRVRWPNPALTVTERRWVKPRQFLRIQEVCTLPADPANLLAARDGDDVVLTWDDPAVPGMRWQVYRGTVPDPTGWGAPLGLEVGDADAVAPGIQFRDAGAAASQDPHHYRVTAVDSCGESL
jgi:hypothetical protein